jgi:hypothetical protein
MGPPLHWWGVANMSKADGVNVLIWVLGGISVAIAITTAVSLLLSLW